MREHEDSQMNNVSFSHQHQIHLHSQKKSSKNPPTSFYVAIPSPLAFNSSSSFFSTFEATGVGISAAAMLLTGGGTAATSFESGG